jgi:hypothetical protein
VFFLRILFFNGNDDMRKKKTKEKEKKKKKPVGTSERSRLEKRTEREGREQKGECIGNRCWIPNACEKKTKSCEMNPGIRGSRRKQRVQNNKNQRRKKNIVNMK